MNKLLNGLKEADNFIFTENGAVAKKSTLNGLADLFGLGAAYRSRSEEDCIFLFKKAYNENPLYALKCLFYLADIRGGQGERRFFRVCARWLAAYDKDAMKRNLIHIPEYRRWDDLLIFIGTDLEKDALEIIKNQLALDVQSTTPSLLAKWLPSENTSSKKTRAAGATVRKYLGFTSRQYRKMLSVLRARINVLERLMSEGRWDEIEFDKIPSKAGLKYKNAFARHDVERMKNATVNVQSYADFAKDETKTVNAKDLYPYEVVAKALNSNGWNYQELSDTDRAIVNKYWDNMTDYFADATFNGLAVVDTSGSMDGYDAAAPINVAISLGMYCAERAKGPFAGHYVSFSSRPQLIKVDGVDFVDKVRRIYATRLVENTNIEATFALLLTTAIRNNCSQEDLPQNIVVISDMEFDAARGMWLSASAPQETLMEGIEKQWVAAGYKMPNLIFWNVNGRHDNFAMTMKNGISFVSGMSPSIFKQLMTGKTAMDLIYETLDSERYAAIG